MKDTRKLRIENRRIMRAIRLACLTGALMCYSTGAYAVANTALPAGGSPVAGGISINKIDNVMNIHQQMQNGVIKWSSFDIGANAIVNFTGDKAGYNILNYINSAKASEIYGELNANNNGNIFIVNPAGITIGKSAQINVGSLYVSNQKLKDTELENFAGNIDNLVDSTQTSSAQLMSLGNINANNVTFVGDRIVLDVDSMKTADASAKLQADKILVKTSNEANLVLGYDAYDDTANSYKGKNDQNTAIAKVQVGENNAQEFTKAQGYMWVEDVDQLQAINTNLNGNYALKNSIDAIVTKDWKDKDTTGKYGEKVKGFNPLGDEKEKFTGKFDGLNYNIFGLYIDRDSTDNVGLFGVAQNATINNVTLVAGEIKGNNNVGAIVGKAIDTTISNSISSANVIGATNVGGLVGYATKTQDGKGVTLDNVVNTAQVQGHENVGGLVGKMEGGAITGQSYNLGNVTGIGNTTSELSLGQYSNGKSIWDSLSNSHNDKRWLDPSEKPVHDSIWIEKNGEIVEATWKDFTQENQYTVTDIRGFKVTLVANTKQDDEIQNISGINKDKDGNIPAGCIELEYMYSGNRWDEDNSTTPVYRKNVVVDFEKFKAYQGNDYSHNIGGLVGYAKDNAVIGNATGTQVFNQMSVNGGYNVGGVVGKMENSKVQNVANNGAVTATGYTAGLYQFHTDNKELDYTTITMTTDGIAKKIAYAANAGGIVGNSSTIENGKPGVITNVVNTGDITTAQEKFSNDNEGKKVEYAYYISGNVGGIVGSAIGTNISNAENKENNVFGAHNVGGIAGYFANGFIDTATNNGGEIKATGARGDTGFVKENIRPSADTSGNPVNEEVIVGNIGGIVGYMYGDDAKITGAGNRGTVHSEDIEEDKTADQATDINKAANVGGIVGKIDRTKTKENEVKVNITDAAVSNSYNTGDVRGYTGVGGIAGMMYNGEIAGSYNLGYLRSTFKGDGYAALNMGGIVGDTTEQTSAKAFLYDVYNKGQIGDSNYDYYGRHLGGIVGRLSGDVEKAYNTGAIYNASVSNGGIAGWWFSGNITNVYNTGNITVLNKNAEQSRVGGIAGSARGVEVQKIENAYNLGTLRTIVDSANTHDSLGGIIGQVINGTKVSINNVYTVGELYCGYKNNQGSYEKGNDAVGAIIGPHSAGYEEIDKNYTISNAYYIQPGDTKTFNDFSDENFTGYSHVANSFKNSQYWLGGAEVIKYEDRFNPNQWKGFFEKNNGEIDTSYNKSKNWRMYYTKTGEDGSVTYTTGTTPILNAFISGLAAKEADWEKTNLDSTIGSVQYGTAYNPLLAIIKLNEGAGTLNVENWSDLGLNKSDSLAVYGGGLTINNFANDTSNTYFGGLLYADGALTINGKADTNLRLGSASEFYGSSVNIKSYGDLLSYGAIKATGKEGASNVTISGTNVEIIGSVTSVAPTDNNNILTTIDGIANTPASLGYDGINAPGTAMPDVAKKYAYDVVKSNASEAGDITIKATAADGAAEVYLGNRNTGILSAGGNITVTGNSVYVDSDIDVGKNLTVESGNGEAVLDISNIGAARKDGDHEKLYEFLDHFASGGGDSKGTLTVESDSNANNAMIAVNMSEDNKTYNTKMYDKKDEDDTFGDYVRKLQNADKLAIWVSSGELLAGIQQYANENENTGTQILSFNFALKNDIDMTGVTGYQGIGGTEAYTGTFDGRGNRIIGLNIREKGNTLPENTGLFTTIGENGVVKNVKIYAGDVSGTQNVGLVAGTNNGSVTNVTAFGNQIVSETNSNITEDYVGGIVGKNAGTITGATAQNVVFSNSSENSFIGGIAGENAGTIASSDVNSALTVTQGTAQAMGGVAGINSGKGEINTVTSTGVISGLYNTVQGTNGTSNGLYYSANQVGGIVGENTGTVSSAYNESIVAGFEHVGGIVGSNNGTIENIANASRIYGGDSVGGIAGLNGTGGDISSGRNNGIILGGKGIKLNTSTAESSGANVGGLVGVSAEGSTMSGLINDMSASITGFENVGGIVGSNGGTLTDSHNLMNHGVISGYRYVGGIAGENTATGKIINISNDNDYNITVNTAYDSWSELAGQNKEFFGGIVGHNGNNGLVADVKNNANISVTGAKYVGGIIGQNDGQIGQKGAQYDGYVVVGYAVNNGTVSGDDYVGGVIGQNNAAISKTDLINTVNGTVSGSNYVGGLIGENNAAVAGGRNDANTMYEHKVYNNGVVSGGNYVGGLVGKNGENAAFTAAYNTGAINGGNYVGGIAGLNSGKIDQVFSSISVLNDTKTQIVAGSVSGKNYVGGLVGKNAGVLSNAYNTSAVAGADAGNIAGANTGNVIGVYSTLASGKLVGDNLQGKMQNAYSVSAADMGSAGVTVLTNEELLLTDSYEGGLRNKNVWKFYNGFTAPLLKVFLTKADYKGFDGTVVGANLFGADDNAAYLGTLKNGTSPLLQSGMYDYFWYLYSGQIAASLENGVFNPNFLGYDLDINYIEDRLIPVYNEEHLWQAEDKYPWYGWDKRRNERERKAEVNFVEGGMTIH